MYINFLVTFSLTLVISKPLILDFSRVGDVARGYCYDEDKSFWLVFTATQKTLSISQLFYTYS